MLKNDNVKKTKFQILWMTYYYDQGILKKKTHFLGLLSFMTIEFF